MQIILALIGLPLVFAVFTLFAKGQKAYGFIIRSAAALIVAATLICVGLHYNDIFTFDLSSYPAVRTVMLEIGRAHV